MSSLSRALGASVALHAGVIGLVGLAPDVVPREAERIEIEIVRLPSAAGGADASGEAPDGGMQGQVARPAPAAETPRERVVPTAARPATARPTRATENTAAKPVLVQPAARADAVQAESTPTAVEATPPADDEVPDAAPSDAVAHAHAVAGRPQARALPQGSGAGNGSGNGSGTVAGTGAGITGIGSGTASGDERAMILARLRARTKRCYPRAARSRRTEGVVDVRFCIDSTGMPTDIDVRPTSGSGVLDDAAIDCVIRGAAPLPAADRCVSVPIDFHLR